MLVVTLYARFYALGLLLRYMQITVLCAGHFALCLLLYSVLVHALAQNNKDLDLRDKSCVLRFDAAVSIRRRGAFAKLFRSYLLAL